MVTAAFTIARYALAVIIRIIVITVILWLLSFPFGWIFDKLKVVKDYFSNFSNTSSEIFKEIKHDFHKKKFKEGFKGILGWLFILVIQLIPVFIIAFIGLVIYYACK